MIATRWMTTCAALMLATPAAVAADAGAATRIGAYDDALVAIMKQNLPISARVTRFQPLVESYYDMPGIAAAVVGPTWSSTSAADRKAITDALARHSAVSLAKNFTKYGGERFQVDPSVQVRGDSSIVKLTIASGSSSDLLYFRMRQAGAVWKIVDVVSGGVSQLAVQRADLASTIASGGVAGAVRKLSELDAKSTAKH